MEKEALLNIILSNLKEVETLVSTFKGKEQILPGFIKLTLQKIDSIKEEIELLQTLPVENSEKHAINSAAASPVKQEILQVPEPLIERIAPQATEIEKPKEPTHINVPDTFIIEREPEPKQIIAPEPVVFASTVSAANEPTIKTEPQPVAPQSKVEEPDIIKQTPIEVAIPPQQAEVKPQLKAETPLHKPNATLGETLVTEKNSVLDKIHATKETGNPALIGKTVDDIKKAIGINDRFLYQRELFGNNAGLMNQTIEELNRMTTYADAQSFIKANFDWDMQEETTASFMNIVMRKFK